jgi:hypothetical protein
MNNKTTNILLGILIIVLIAIGIIIVTNQNQNPHRDEMVRNEDSILDHQNEISDQSHSNTNQQVTIKQNITQINNSNSADTVKLLYIQNNKPTQISECVDSDNKIFFQVRYEPTGDLGTGIYSFNGTELGVCGAYTFNNSEDRICSKQLSSCKVVYQNERSFGPETPGINVYNVK